MPAPKAIGPYSRAVKFRDIIFISGQLGLDPATGKLAGGIAEQTRQALKNLAAVLGEMGATTKDVAKTTVYLKSMDDFDEMNKTYASFFSEPYPARTTVGVAALPKGGLVEIDAIAVMK
ncbi:MAG: RidA family protein [Euryarchaeota archaeon]|nr:RidA family protein [Euryarchaeota archaeon]